ncbi:hypothetical protein P171DRAFT_509215 [Karstenula rhodostoma CBS 690.94]|uniref:Uncharacterized protein n=1 Tax=Karstenula rhodostoma CBS 690.94 TaxID=1392251 RepID=A0A9P4UG75_9PLEO|nr:hypothetical protein P171DRAFT_509215 [Karstenula rhodostoma CBS 690.94]
MPWPNLLSLIPTMTSTPPFSLSPQLSNPILIFPSLMRYHTLSRGPKHPPTLAILPYRTYLVNRADFDAMVLAQTHAFYEEIDSIAANDVGVESPFGHWYVIHPLLEEQVRGLSTEVLGKLREWVERGGFVGGHYQVEAFRGVRGETLGVVKKELWKREVNGVVDVDGLGELGAGEDGWAVVRPGV